jgi:DNA-binding CsgD family transcriptional regulator
MPPVSARPGAAPLLERELELERVDGLLAATTKAEGRCLVIEGRAGIGKTALLTELRARAHRAGMLVCAARGTELESEFAFGVVRQLFEHVVRERGQGPFEGAAALAAPIIGVGGDGGAAGEFAALHGLYWLTADLAAETPMLLAVDDAHWSDVASLRWLAYLLNRLEELPVLVALAARPVRSGPAGEALSALLAEPAVAVTQLAPLREGSVASLLAQALGAEPDPTFASACHRATAGNPLAVRGVIGDLVADGVQPSRAAAATLERRVPSTIARRVLAHLARSGAPARQLARALAVLGDGTETRLVAALAELDEAQASAAADELAAVDLLVPERPLRFGHPLLRAAVYDELSPGTRSALHRRAAGLLASTGAEAEAVAGQLLRCESAADPVTVERLRAAAPLALRRGAPPAAATYLRRALAEAADRDVRGQVLAELGHAEHLAGDPAALDHLWEALRSSTDPIVRAAVRADIAAVVLEDGRPQQSTDVLGAAAVELRGGEPNAAVRLEVAVIGLSALDPGRAASLAGSLPRLRELADGDGPFARHAQIALGWILALRGEPRVEALRWLEWCFDDRSFLAGETSDSHWATWAGLGLYYLDELTQALAWSDDMVADAAARGGMTGLVLGTGLKTWAEHRQGWLAEARSDGEAALDLARQHSAFMEPICAARLADILAEQGHLGEAMELVEQLQLRPQVAGALPEANLLDTRGRLRCAAGRPAEGIADLRRCAEIGERLRWRSPTVFGWRPALVLALAPTDPEEARRLADTEVEVARRSGIPGALGVALRTAAALERGPQAVDLLAEAEAQLQESPAVLELARTLADRGAALRRLGHRVDARRSLLQALEIATRCGAVPLAERARAEALLAGARPRRPRMRGLEALTPGELRVARLAAEGRSNREVAQALLITTKTVKDHLGSAYGKLDITSREELGAALARSVELQPS